MPNSIHLEQSKASEISNRIYVMVRRSPHYQFRNMGNMREEETPSIHIPVVQLEAMPYSFRCLHQSDGSIRLIPNDYFELNGGQDG